jgi:hypothetical protein
LPGVTLRDLQQSRQRFQLCLILNDAHFASKT